MSEIFYLVAGFAGLVLCGGALVQGAAGLARGFGVSPMVIGLTLVGFGTSAPELVTSVQAALAGSPGIAIGNIVGSNIANTFLILGVAALILPIVVDKSVARDGFVMLGATIACCVILVGAEVTRAQGGVLVTALAIYLVLTLRAARNGVAVGVDLPDTDSPARPMWRHGLFLVGGIAGTIIAARILVGSAITLARDWGVSETLIGLTIVAVGTSLPELVTSAVAARRGQSDIALGNIIGSNIFNILGILGVTALVTPISVPDQVMATDVWVLLGSAILVLAVAAACMRISRTAGCGLVALYAGYTIYLVATS